MKVSNSKNYKTGEPERSSDTSNKLLYLLVGGGIGAVVALLFAPKQGSDLRGDIARATRDGLDYTKEKAGALKVQSAEVVQNLRDKASAAYEMAASKITAGCEDTDHSASGETQAGLTDGEPNQVGASNIMGRSSQVF